MPNKRKNQKFDDSNSTDSTPLGALPLTTDQLVELANILAKIMLPTIEVAVRTAVAEVLSNNNSKTIPTKTILKPYGANPRLAWEQHLHQISFLNCQIKMF